MRRACLCICLGGAGAQASDANWLQKAASSNNNSSSSESNIQIIDLANSRLLNIAEFGSTSDKNSSGISATAKCECDDSTEQPQRVNIEIEKVRIKRIPDPTHTYARISVAPYIDSLPPLFRFDLSQVELRLGGLVIPLPLGVGSKGYLDILYLDEEEGIRISKGNKGSIFVHVRENEDEDEA